MPGEHAHREDQDGGVEQLLPRPVEEGRQPAREDGHKARADQPAENTETHPQAAPGHTLGGGQHDADNQAGLDDLAEDDEQGAEHGWASLREAIER